MAPIRRFPAGPAGDERGQTGVDFVVGVGVFLLTVGFAIAFAPGLLTPFGGEATLAPVVADRLADDLVHDALAGQAGPSSLDTGCTLAFFGLATATECPFDAAGSPEGWLGLPPGMHLNVTLEGDVDGRPGREVHCGNGGGLVECAAGTTPLAYGEPVPAGGNSVAAAVRVVTVDGTDAVLVVRTW